MEQIIKDNILNILLCLLVVVVGYILTRKQNKLADVTGSYQLRAYTPTIWTSLGILGTFVSILISLYFFVKSESDDINLLIYNIAPAFTTSIIGIFGSIITSLKNKRFLARVEGKEGNTLVQLNKQIATNSASYSPEIILLEILKEIKDNREKSSKENSDLIKELKSLTEIFNETISNLQISIEGKIDSLNTGVKNEGNATRTATSEALRIQSDNFKEAVRGIESEFRESLSGLSTMWENKLNTLNNTLDSKIDSMNTKVDNAFDRLINATEKSLAIESQKRNDELKNFISEENNIFTSFIGKVKSDVDSIVKDVTKLFNEDIKVAIEEFAKMQTGTCIETITKANDDMIIASKDVLTAFTKNMTTYTEAMELKVGESNETFNTAIEKALSDVSSKLDELHKKQAELIETTISRNNTNIETLLNSNKDAINSVAREIKENADNSITANRDNLSQLLEATKQSITQVANEIKQDNESIKNELVESQKRWKSESETLEKNHTNKVIEIHAKAESEIADILSKIISTESALRENLNGIKDEINKSVAIFTERLNEVRTKAVSINQETLHDLKALISSSMHVDDLQIASTKLSNNIKETLGVLDKNSTNISNNLSKINESISESAAKYEDSIRNYDEKLKYIGSILNLFQQHITDMAVLRSVLEETKMVLKQAEESNEKATAGPENDKNTYHRALDKEGRAKKKK